MIVGEWPLQHLYTLYKLHRDTGTYFVYDVDANIITSDISRDVFLEKYHLSMSEDMYEHIRYYIPRNIAPPVPDEYKSPLARERRGVPDMIYTMDRAPAVINGDATEAMEMIGARWNSYFSCWIIDAEQLVACRRKKKCDGKIYHTPISDKTIKIYGDVTPYIRRIKDAGGYFDPESEDWYISYSNFRKLKGSLF